MDDAESGPRWCAKCGDWVLLTEENWPRRRDGSWVDTTFCNRHRHPRTPPKGHYQRWFSGGAPVGEVVDPTDWRDHRPRRA